MGTKALVLLLALSAPALVAAQLRPRRVGTSALGEQQEMGSVGADPEMVEPMAAQMGGLSGLEGMADLMNGGGAGAADLLQKMMGNMDLENNPMLKGLAAANPELAKLMSDPEAMKAQMEQMAELMTSPEGQDMAQKMMKEMQSVLTDPEKLTQGLQQLSENPALKGLAEAVPGLQEMLDDPVAMQEQVQKTAELFQNMGDPSKLSEMLGSLGNMEGMEQMQEAMRELMQGGNSEALAEMMGALGADAAGGSDGSDLKGRVREQLAKMMARQPGGAGAAADPGDLDEF